MIRTHLDLEVAEGEEGKLASILQDPDVLKQIGNFLVNVALPRKDEASEFKVVVAGGHSHEHTASRRDSCPECVALSTLAVFQMF